MVKVTQRALRAICKALTILPENLEFLSGGKEHSDGILYTYPHNGRKRVLKILAVADNEHFKITNLSIRMNYAYHLAGYGIKIAAPLDCPNGKLYVTAQDNGHIYIAYIMDFADGKSPEANEMSDEIIENWGRLTGKAHRISKIFTEGRNYDAFSARSEIEFFKSWCRDEVAKRAWTDLEIYIRNLDTDIDSYGFIHNDNHKNNILVKDNIITLIDFDVASCNFYIQDITTAAQEIMFKQSGGMYTKYSNPLPLQRFMEKFIGAYLQENTLSQKWFDELTTFINYRRLLLFTCMQNWLETEPELKKGILENIKNPPKITL